MSNDRKPTASAGSWLAGVIVMVAVVVAYMGFARVSVIWTLVISTLVLVGLVAFLWRAGASKERGGGRRR